MNPSQTSHQDVNVRASSGPPPDPAEGFVRLPGLLRRWELEQVVHPFADYQIEPAGKTADGTEVFAVYHRGHTSEDDSDVSVPVTVTFENGPGPVRARFVPLDDGEPHMGILIVSHDPDDAHLQGRVRDLLARMPASTAPAELVPASSQGAAHAAQTETSSCSRRA